MMKRTLDVVVAAVALAVLSPVLLILAILIPAESRGPIMFRQTRVGRNGREFQILKLRSMVVDAPSLGGHSTAPGDPRITRVGRIVRKSSLDEIPQLFNVLRGEMSLVGPRPAVPAQLAEYQPADWARRLTVKPGITGLAQVSGRSAATFDERLAADLEYVDSHSVVEDLRICVKTFAQMARGGTN